MPAHIVSYIVSDQVVATDKIWLLPLARDRVRRAVNAGQFERAQIHVDGRLVWWFPRHRPRRELNDA